MNLKAKINDMTIITAIVFIGSLFMLAFKMKHSIGFINLDEFLWMYRSRFFIDRILTYDFSNLVQSAQPGIMVMWFAGPFMKLIDYDFSSIVHMIEELGTSGGYNVINDTSRNYYEGYEYISFFFNVPIVFLMIAFIVISYLFMRKIGFCRRAIAISMILVATSPYYIFFTTPTDKLVGIFVVFSLLSLFIYTDKKGDAKFLVISGFFGSWAALTKMSALLLVPFSIFIIFFMKWERRDLANKSDLYGKMKSSIREIAVWLSVFFATSVVFLPTIVSDPGQVAKLFMGETSSRFVTENGSFSFFGSIIRYLGDPFLLSFNVFIMIVFTFFLFLIVQKVENRIKMRKVVKALYIFVFSFFIFTAFFSKEYSFRYLVPALLFFQIISGLGIHEFSEILARKSGSYSKNETYAWALIFVLVSQALLIYYSEIVPIN